MASATDQPYGSWESPITSKAITAGSVPIGSLHLQGKNLFWLEGRPKENGRYVLCRYDPNSKEKSERNAVDMTPKDSNVRTRVHEYGGAAVTMADGGCDDIFYSDFSTQRLCKLSPSEENINNPKPITPDVKNCRYRFADGIYDTKSKKIFMVREDHFDNAKPKDVVNEIVAVHSDGSFQMDVMANGNDFYSNPRLSPDKTKLAYITWNHPNMPWDATELRVMLVDSSSADTSSHELIEGSDGDTSVIQPLFHPTTGDLYYISDKSGYYNIYREGHDASILPMETDFGGKSPGWSLGQQGFIFLPKDGRLVTHYKNKEGSERLLVANVVGNQGMAKDIQEFGTEHGLPRFFSNIIANEENDLYFLGGGPSTPVSVYKWNLDTPDTPPQQLACTSSLSFPEDVISAPKQIEFPTTGGKTAFGYYYAPKNASFKCTSEGAPPLLVKAHGGPTSCTSTVFNPGLQYWTSRGFAILDVDYGGSTGYGRSYRRRLRKSWGIVDIDDVCAGALYLVEQGLADKNRLCIDGGSAGGYTTLSALTFKDVFTAGCSKYGIGDLTALAGDTHKFESRYLDGLVGSYPEDEEIYKERSPIEHTDKLSSAILLLQGVEDKVVPPNQAEMMHDVLKKKGLPTCLKMYKGEQHGFRKSENIEDSIDSELSFFARVYSIDLPADTSAIELKIDNM